MIDLFVDTFLAKRIKETCKLGANNYKTAIKWILEADELKEDKAYEGDQLCWEFDIPFKHRKLFFSREKT